DTAVPGKLPALGMKSAGSLAVDPDGNLLLGDGRSGVALKVDPSGKVTARIPLANLQAVTAGRRGTPVLAGGGMVIVGTQQRPLVRPDASSPRPVKDSAGLAVGRAGRVVVVDGAAGRVVVLDPTGKRVLATLVGDKTKGGLAEPQRVEVDRQGRLYVYDRKADAILRFN